MIFNASAYAGVGVEPAGRGFYHFSRDSVNVNTSENHV